MIRSLHEIEPPKLSLPSEPSNKSEDSTAQESLAAEFKKLLERARSGIAGVRDEVSALGFALSQAVSTVQHQREEIRVADEDGRTQVEGPTEDVSDTGSGAGDSVQVVDGNQCSQRSAGGPAVEDEIEDEEVVSTELESLVEEGVDLEGDGEEIVLDDEVAFIDSSDVGLKDEVTINEQTLAAQVVAQNAQNAQKIQVVDGSGDVEERISTESSFQRVVLNGSDEEEEGVEVGDEFTDAGVLARSATSEMARPELRTQHGPEHDTQEYSTGDEELDRFLEKYRTDTPTEEFNGGQESRMHSALADNSGGLDLDRVSNPLKRELSAWKQDSMVEGFVPSKDQNKELSIQLTLLRQAFDTLKTQMIGQGEARSKSSSSGISGVGASAEPKATQNDSAPRAARYLNRAASQKMMERIETAIKEAARSRDGKTITLRLEPLQLGQVKCDVSMRDGLLHARITPQNQEVVQTVREHSHELQSALRRLGLNVDRVTVQVLSEKEAVPFANTAGFLDGKSFQENDGKMPTQQGQTPERSFGNKFADVSAASTPDAGIAPADHWIA